MKLKAIFTLKAIIFGLSTLNFLFLTDQMFRFYSPEAGYDPGPDVVWTGRILASFFLMVAVIAWLARDAEPSRGRTAIVVGFVAGNAMNGLIHLLAILNGGMNAFGWAIVVLSILLAAGFWLRRNDP